jgi:hypothetical protein
MVLSLEEGLGLFHVTSNLPYQDKDQVRIITNYILRFNQLNVSIQRERKKKNPLLYCTSAITELYGVIAINYVTLDETRSREEIFASFLSRWKRSYGLTSSRELKIQFVDTIDLCPSSFRRRSFLGKPRSILDIFRDGT